MLTEEQKKQFTSLRVEIIDLDICASFFIRKANRFAHLWHATSRAFILEELTALRYLENGIILHLTNLDDDNHNSDFSFRSAATEFNKSSKNPKTIKALHETLKSYRKEINELKVKHRNNRIAHLNYDEELGFDQFLNFEKMLLPVILEANRIADMLWGENINAIFDLGSWEGKLDFKTNLSGLKMDGNATKNFTSNKLVE
jgi:hypothetical protein